MFHRSLRICITILILIETGLAADVPFVFDDSTSAVAGYSSDQIEQAYAASSDLAGVPMVTSATDDEVIRFAVRGEGNAPEGKTENKVRELKEAFDARVEPGNSIVRHEAVVFAAKYPGDHTIDQICSIYSYLNHGDDSRKGWSYVSDPKGIDYFMYANETLKIGEDANCAGAGDCDDFAILTASLVESIGGSAQIILVHNNSTGGHAYAEVYLGKLNDQYSEVEAVLDWLKNKFAKSKIYTHIDTESKDVWLNLDWSADHPGGPFYQGDRHIVLCIREIPGAKSPQKVPAAYQEILKKGIIVPPDALTNESLPNSAEAWYNKGNVLLNQGKFNEAVEAYDEALGRKSSYVKAWVGKSVALCYQGKYDETTKACDEAIRLDSNYAYAWCNMGAALNNLGRDEEAIKYLDEAIRLDPKLAMAWYNKGLSLGKLEQYDDAISAFSEAIRLNPSFVEAWNSKGVYLEKLDRHDEAIDYYNKAIELDPNYASTWYNKGLALCKQDKYEEALQTINKAIALDPNDADAWYTKGLTLYNWGKYGEALLAINKAIEINPNLEKAWLVNGLALYRQGRYDEAIRCYNRAIDLDPKDADAWTFKGTTIGRQGRYSEAILCINKAIEINPNLEETWYAKGLAHYYLGEFNEAVNAYDKAIEINPKNAPAFYYKATALKALGRNTEADAAFALAQQLGYNV